MILDPIEYDNFQVISAKIKAIYDEYIYRRIFYLLMTLTHNNGLILVLELSLYNYLIVG